MSNARSLYKVNREHSKQFKTFIERMVQEFKVIFRYPRMRSLRPLRPVKGHLETPKRQWFLQKAPFPTTCCYTTQVVNRNYPISPHPLLKSMFRSRTFSDSWGIHVLKQALLPTLAIDCLSSPPAPGEHPAATSSLAGGFPEFVGW